MYTAEKIRAGSICEFSDRYRGSLSGSTVDFVEVFYSNSFKYFEIPTRYNVKHISNIIKDFVAGSRTLIFSTLPASFYVININGDN